MDKNAMKEHISNLKEIVLDEKRLVTYVSLSKELCLHVNDTKVLMKGFIDEIKNSSESNISISYIVSGLCTDNKAKTVVCTGNELQSVKESFQVFFYEHVYSISYGQSHVDNVSFMATNKFEDLVLSNGVVKNDLCCTRTTEELNRYQTAQISPSYIKPEYSGSIKLNFKEEVTKKESKTTNGISNQTIQTAPNTKFEIVDEVQTLKKKAKVDIKKEPKKGIAGFFNKQVQNSSNKTETKAVKSSENVGQKKIKFDSEPEKMDVDNDTRISKNPKSELGDVIKSSNNPKIDKNGIKQNNVKKNNEKKATNKNTNLEKIKKNAKVDKKRKRVLTVSDSESEDEQNDPFQNPEEHVDHNSDIEDEIPPTPTNNTVKITSGITNPRKRRKIVDKTYTDEDGYILTKKEEIYESCSDNEENIPKVNKQTIVEVKKESSLKGKASETKNKNNKITPPQKGKQATLMSFFKKV